MKKLFDAAAKALAKITYTAAMAGASKPSFKGTYQPKTPKALLK